MGADSDAASQEVMSGRVAGVNGFMHVMPTLGRHDDVMIIGDRAALQQLAEAIHRSLSEGEAITGTLRCRDGAEYQVVVLQATAEQIKADAPLPYATKLEFQESWPQWMSSAYGRAIAATIKCDAKQ
jgi:hypothetical protein